MVDAVMTAFRRKQAQFRQLPLATLVQVPCRRRETVAETNQTVATPNVALLGPTPESIARALEAQRRERASFNRETGIKVDGDGSIHLRD